MATVLATTSNPESFIHDPEPMTLEGRRGWRYWLAQPLALTGHAEVDARLSVYPVAVFQPPRRAAHETPVVVALQGMAVPYEWNAFLVPTLLDLGIACVLFDTPGAGVRSVSRAHDGDVVTELTAMAQHGALLTADAIPRLFEGVAQDHRAVLRLAAERHGLTSSRIALFGVSLGALLSAYTFLRYGAGERLLGAIGHADLARFARSYMPALGPLLATLPVGLLHPLVSWMVGARHAAGLGFVEVLHRLSDCNGEACTANPMSYLDRDDGRPVRFLVGADDPLVRPADARRCAARFRDGACYIVPRLAHGGDGFIEHVRYYLATQLSDWSS